MAGPPRRPQTPGPPERTEEGRKRPGAGSTSATTPTWVKVFAVVLGVLVLALVALQLTGLGGVHGPARHLPGATPTAPVDGDPPTAVPGEHVPPDDHQSPGLDPERPAPDRDP